MSVPSKSDHVALELDMMLATPINDDGTDPTEMRMEYNLLGDLGVKNDWYYGIQTLGRC